MENYSTKIVLIQEGDKFNAMSKKNNIEWKQMHLIIQSKVSHW